MNKMNILQISKEYNINFSNNANQNNENEKKDNIKDSILLINELYDSINSNVSQSVFDLVTCFICLSPANEPFTCPKCNNFACKQCLEAYFGREKEKRCPLCKREINLNELEKNTIVEEIENILNKKTDRKNKVEELEAIIEEKKKSWKNQINNINFLIEKIFKFQENLQNYKKEYELFLKNCQQLIEKTFDDLTNKIENMINSLLSYNNIADDSIKKYNDIYENSQQYLCDNNNIKKLINEILYLEKNHFNNRIYKETEDFLNSSIKLVPSINIYNIKWANFQKQDFNNNSTMTYIGTHFKLGNFKVRYELMEGYNCLCNFEFTLDDSYKKKMCFIISQLLTYKNNNKQKSFIMKLNTCVDKYYNYKCEITCEELLDNENEVQIKTEALIFTL